MAPAALPLQIPGYAFDGKRYFKILPGSKPPPRLAPASADDSKLSQGRRRKKLKRTLEKGKQRAVEPSTSALRSQFDGHLERDPRARLHHGLESLSIGRLHHVETLYPDCLPLDESIVVVSFDDLDPSTVRVGGSGGSIATGSLTRAADEESWYPNDEQGWRTGWMFPSRITSLKTCGDRILATCLGQPAQAVVGTTSDNISLASVTLSPRKTSLWTSALSRDLVALGCDRKVLISRDPTRAQMEGYVTGGRHGDGAVFALDLTENLIFAGTRRGEVQVFDQRSSPPGDQAVTTAEMHLTIGSSVTHVRRIRDGLLVAGMDGSIGMYDLRFPRPKPFLAVQGHVNSYTRDVGLDTWRDEFVAAGGQDGRIRLWSLRTGLQLHSPNLGDFASPLNRQFSELIKALAFTGSDALSPHRRDDGALLRRSEREAIDAVWQGGGMGPKLWVGDGPGLESFSVEG